MLCTYLNDQSLLHGRNPIMTDSTAIASMFKTYDIRGIAPAELSPDVAYKVGRALVIELGVDAVAVGRDMRTTGQLLASSLIDGILDQGADVTDLGLVSTDALYFAVGKFGFPAGVMITASHNPPEYNGFKLCKSEARAVSFEDGISQIRDRVVNDDFPPPAESRGALMQKDVLNDYATHVLSLVDTSAIKPLRIAIDAGNGMGGKTSPLVFGRLPVDVTPLYFELDGTFPNHLANPLEPENVRDLQKAVVDGGLDLGIAFDGDADRMFLIDDKGKAVGGDMVTAMVAIALLKQHPGAAICYNLICSKSVPEIITAHGGRPIRTPVGHSLIKKIMREQDAVFGGEHSGHFYFRDNWYADSGIIAALTVLQLVSEQGKPVSEVLAPLDTRFRSGEINTRVSDARAIIASIEQRYTAEGGTVDHLDGVTIEFPNWWFSLRSSNTEPLLRLNVEADDRETLAVKTTELQALIAGNS
jgi:phosphomannomutase